MSENVLSESAAAQAPSSATRYTPFYTSDPHEAPETLRARMDEQGYLFFRRLLPAEVVLEVRRDVLTLCAQAGWLDPSRDLMEAVVGPGVQPTTEGQPDYLAVYRDVLRLPRFHDFPTQPALMAVARVLLGEEALVHPRRIGRITFPRYTAVTTPPHQDYYYIRGAVTTYSCWTPLGDCPQELGGLAVWPGSQTRGFLEHTVTFPGAVGGHGLPVDEAQADWHTTDFETGDALFFHSYTIHKALPNLTPDRLRLSTDNRYQRPGEAIDPSALRPHFAQN